MDRILQDFWNSNIDITGRFLEASTSYQIIRKSHRSYTKDQEKIRRFYIPRNVKEIRPHILQFEVWKKSMFIRYVCEAVIFIGIAAAFQYYVTNFNVGLHTLRKDIAEQKKVENEFPDSYKNNKDW